MVQNLLVFCYHMDIVIIVTAQLINIQLLLLPINILRLHMLLLLQLIIVRQLTLFHQQLYNPMVMKIILQTFCYDFTFSSFSNHASYSFRPILNLYTYSLGMIHLLNFMYASLLQPVMTVYQRLSYNGTCLFSNHLLKECFIIFYLLLVLDVMYFEVA